MSYQHNEIEKKWQKKWYDNNYFKVDVNSSKDKYYSLDMFPYPSGTGLHVGHPKGYTATDIISRYKRMNGYEVLHPIGWDSFGLPAEQHAIKTGESPEKTTKINTDNFRKQLKSLGLSYDYDLELKTSSPDYYKTTQWIFSKLHEKGLTEYREEVVNWCEGLGTVLSNEEVLTDKDGKMVSERGSFPVIKKPMKQWVLKITKYADRLIEGLEDLDWPNSVINLQKNWIGKSSGYNIKFKSNDLSDITVFTTMPEYFDGVKFIIVAPDNKIAKSLIKKDIEKGNSYIEKTKSMTMIDRKKMKESPDVFFTGSFVKHPKTNIDLPVFLGSFVMPDFGEGTLLGVPQEGNRDQEIANNYNDVVNQEKFILDSNFNVKEFLLNKFVDEKINYKLKDWLFSRQRYWGEPFPIIHLENGEIILDPNLPLLLPKIEDYKPKGGRPPLANANHDWINTVVDGKKGKRELNTMPQWAGSCWYYIGYLLKKEDGYHEIDSKEAKKIIDKWLPVDLYIGGQEHAVLHLLYARFWMLFLHDIGITKNKEPFKKLYNQGMILGTDGEKMSKSRGNTISPDEIISEFGADTLRTYEMFMGSLDDSKSWSNEALKSIRKWLERVHRLFDDKKKIVSKNDHSLDNDYNVFIKSATNNLDSLKFNLVVSDMMIFINSAYKCETLYDKYLKGFLQVLSLYAPHLASEIFELFDHTVKLDYVQWPKSDSNLINKKDYKIMIQINGKIRSQIDFKESPTEKMVIESSKVDSQVIKYTDGKEIKKHIYIKDKILNIVVV